MLLIANISWPPQLISAVRAVRHLFARISEETLLGVPLDWPVRFVLVGAVYCILRIRLSTRAAAAIVLAFLFGKELFDIVAHQNLQPRAPDLGDLADLASGLAGLFCGGLIIRRLRRAERAQTSTRDSSETEPG